MESPQIETERFFLRMLTENDASEEYLSWFSDPVISRYIQASRGNTVGSIKEYIAGKRASRDALFLGIFLRSSSRHIGNLKFEPIDELSRSATLGIMIGEAAWRGRGVAQEVVRASVLWLLRNRGIDKVALGVDRDNLAAIRAYRKIGFREVGSDREKPCQMLWDVDPLKKIALGTVLFGMRYGIAGGNKLSVDEASQVLRTASINGIKTIDTARDYGDSETVLGSMSVRDWEIITKIGPVPSDCRDAGAWIHSNIQSSLTRLNVQKLNGALLHRPGQLSSPHGPRIYEALMAAKAKGWVQNVGISIYDPEELGPIMENYSLDIVQAPASVIDRRLMNSTWPRQLRESGVELHVRSIFLQGLLLLPSGDRATRFSKWKSIWTVWDAWIKQNETSALEVCLKFAAEFLDASKIVLGVESTGQLLEIIELLANGRSFGSWPEVASEDPELVNPSIWKNS